MKKIILLLCSFLFINLAVYAQTTVGNLLIGGHIGWNTLRSDDTFVQLFSVIKQNQFMFTGNFGTFVKADLAAGLLFRQEFNNTTRREDLSQTPVSTTTNRTNTITAGPFIRKYFALGQRFSFYTQAMLGYSFNNYKTEHDYIEFSTSKSKNLVANLQPGLAFFASNKIGIDLTVPGLEYTLRKAKYGVTNQGFSAKFNLPALNLGLSIYLNR